jgi:cupin superfamily acireductone dioxygenase involved in methionine salvage
MQFDPEHYPVKDYNFIPTSTLGIMAREYEVSQLVQLLQTMSPESPMYPALVKSIVQNMNITNREELVAILDQAAQPNPEQQQMQKMQFEQEMRFKEAQTSAVEAQANESNQRAAKYAVEAQELPKENEIRKIDAITKNLQPGAGEDTEFVRRLKIAETKLKEKEVNLKEKDLQFRHEQAKKEEQAGNALASLIGKG